MSIKQYKNYLSYLFDERGIDSLESQLIYLQMQAHKHSNPIIKHIFEELYDICEDYVEMYYMLY